MILVVEDLGETAADDPLKSDQDGEAARQRWRKLPDAMRPSDWTPTQAVQHQPVPEKDNTDKVVAMWWAGG